MIYVSLSISPLLFTSTNFGLFKIQQTSDGIPIDAVSSSPLFNLYSMFSQFFVICEVIFTLETKKDIPEVDESVFLKAIQ